MPQADVTPTQEVKDELVAAVEVPKPEQEASVSEALKVDEVKRPSEIPYSRFKEKVDEVSELKKKVEDLEKRAEASNMSTSDISKDLDSIAKEYNLDADVLGKVASAIEARAQQSIEEKLRPMAEAQQLERREKMFNEHFARALENNPQYKDVVNPEVIKALAYNPANAQKTFSQLLEMAYGKMVEGQGKKTLEQTTPRGGGEGNNKMDYKRARNDSGYFKEVMSDPKLREEYNAQMLNDVSRYL